MREWWGRTERGTDMAARGDGDMCRETSKAQIRVGARSLNDIHRDIESIIRPATRKLEKQRVGINVARRGRVDWASERIDDNDHARVSSRALGPGYVAPAGLGEAAQVGRLQAEISGSTHKRNASWRRIRGDGERTVHDGAASDEEE